LARKYFHFLLFFRFLSHFATLWANRFYFFSFHIALLALLG